MFSPVEEIKNRLDIVEVIGSYIKLEKAGRNFRARCPFHNEKTPSFMVSQERQTWHCFGCGVGGDIFSFVQQIDGLEFGDALRLLAQRAGVELQKQDPSLQTKRKRLYEICGLAALFFEKQLESQSGRQAYSYLTEERGVSSETAKKWRLGWAPDGWHNLENFLRQKGYKEQEVFDAGLAVRKEDGGIYDRFRSRIMFPLFDIQGQVIGFAGRIFGKEDANAGKYINTPQTFLYDKSRVLYGLNFAKQAMRQQDACIFVEGNLDVIMSHQAGLENAVASSGTALTAEHLKIVKRYTLNLIFSFDTDLAGQTATRRSIDLALANDLSVKVVQIEEKDPADLIKNDPQLWKSAAEKAVPFVEYLFGIVFRKFGGSGLKAEDKKQIGKILLPVIKEMPSRIEQSHWISELSQRLKTDEKTLYGEMQKIKEAATPARPADRKIIREKRTRGRDLEERIVSLWLNYPAFLKDFAGEFRDIFSDEDLAAVCHSLRKCVVTGEDLKKFNENLKPELTRLADFLALKCQQMPCGEEEAADEIKSCLKELRILKLKKEMAEMVFEVQEASREKSKDKLGKIMEKFKKLSGDLIELTRG